MFKLMKWAIIIITIIVALLLCVIMALGQGNRFTNSNSNGSFDGNGYNSQDVAYEFCSYVEEIKAHVADYVAVEGGSNHVEFLQLFQTPVERKNRVAHMMADGINNNTFNVDLLFDHGYDDFIENAAYYNELYSTTFPVEDCMKNIETRNLQSLVNQFSHA